MSKIINIGTLDVRGITEELAKEITVVKNIGMLIESDESQLFLKSCEKKNVGANIKIPKDVEVKTITQNGDVKLDRDYLEGLNIPVIMSVNGRLDISSDVDTKLFDEKIYYILVNGELVCTKKLVGLIQSKGMINGNLLKYNTGYKFFPGSVKLTNGFIKSLKPDSKLSYNQLLITEDIDMELFKERISNIEVLGKLIIMDEYEGEISVYIDDYYQVDKILIPIGIRDVHYIDNDISINDSSIKKYSHAALYVDGDVEIFLENDFTFSEYIEHLFCDKVVCNEKSYNMIKASLDNDVEVEIITGKLLKNTGNMTLSGDIEEKVTIRNMGKLIIDENINDDKFNENVVLITNYGLVEVPEEKLSMVKNKVRDNYGKIGSPIEKKDEVIQNEEHVLYANMGELKL